MRIPSNKIKDIIRFAHQELDGLYPEGEVDSMTRILLEEVSDRPLAELLADKEQTVNESDLLTINFAIKDLKKEKPLQQILGYCDFAGVRINLNRKVLIPRVETEELTMMIIRENKGRCGLKILDACCGSGCMALALAGNIPESVVTAVDLSMEAIEQTRENAQANALNVEVVAADVFSDMPFDTCFDIIVSNPPYVRESEKAMMRNNVLLYEPHSALFVKDEDPLTYYRALCRIADRHLRQGGVLYLEINEGLAEQTEAIFKPKYDTLLSKDLRDKYRFLRVRKV
ncbi:MAG TPA: peptide chain release factor N(5)-glutamine methyltransferase [Candidatus Onthomorpha intestinigallinarum]|uniref:peptide chain release factor N(5)-glutamine methyltransferase n=1 Tax=Candidatus Onthomorpha intestinigallinarum TaxID=2840880 RepID=A0A9D1UIZ6_9BACT|nr:peptide chain release factor N(5)-glutamine methyltransferase [Candidatus Onthomorpha intestinigallinarum]